MFIPYIGIDPGKTGALALLWVRDGLKIAQVEVFSFKEVFENKEPDLSLISQWLCVRDMSDVVIYMEQVHAMPFIGEERRQGSVSSFNFGKTAGMIYGYLTCYFHPTKLNMVSPQKWKNTVLGKDHAPGKQGAIDHCLLEYSPSVLNRTVRSRVPDHNIADAICIAEYGFLSDRGPYLTPGVPVR